jgi:hypothetical protein
MAYQVYFADLTEENRGLLLAVLKLKEEAGTLEPGEAERLYEIRGSETPTPLPPEEQPQRPRQNNGGGGGRRGPSRRGPRNQSNNNGGSNSSNN